MTRSAYQDLGLGLLAPIHKATIGSEIGMGRINSGRLGNDTNIDLLGTCGLRNGALQSLKRHSMQ